MIWDTTNSPNFLACAQALQATGFNVQVADLTVNGRSYKSVCAGGEAEVHLLNMVAVEEECGGYVDPEELLANAQTLRSKNEGIHQRQMLTSVKRVLDRICNREINEIVISQLDPDRCHPLHHAEMRNMVLLQAQQDFLTTTLEQVIAQHQSK